MTTYQIIFCTCPDQATSEALAKRLVMQKLAACVNILPGLTSIYRWQNQIESAQEHLLIIKSTQAQYAAIEQTLKHYHPYDVPEIIALPISQGLPAYLDWIEINSNPAAAIEPDLSGN